MTSKVVVGVLALQGAFAKHIEIMKSLGVEVVEVRKPCDLERCHGLIIPGGESTVIMRQIDFIGMKDKLREFATQRPVFGTCAGLILMANHICGLSQESYNIIDIDVERNAFGRQIDSFRADIEFQQGADFSGTYPALFIRAPRIRRCGPTVKVLAQYFGEPVLVREGWHLGASFHPELTGDPAIHRYFLQMIFEKLLVK